MKIQIIFTEGMIKLQETRFRGILKEIKNIESLQGLLFTDHQEDIKKAESSLNRICNDYGIKKGNLYVSDSKGKTWKVKEFLKKEKADFTLFYGNETGQRLGIKSATELSLPCYTDVIGVLKEKREYRIQRKVYNMHADGWYKLSKKHAVLILLPSGGNDEETLSSEEITGLVQVSEWNCEADEVNYAEIISREKKPDTDIFNHADVVFIGGRGLKSRENFESMIAAADHFGAAWGCTRAVALAGWCDYSRVIGISGTQISPKVCILFGVSGAAPFLFGIEQAKTVIAINKDKSAPVFGVADYGIIKDCIPMVKRLREGE